MSNNTIPIGSDGFYHPSTEDEIIQLVKKAYDEKQEIRCRGAAHSVSRVIYTDPGKGDPPTPNRVSEQKPPKGPNLNLMLDNYMQLTWIDEKNGIIEVEAGIHLGKDPLDPTGKSSLENSLLYQTFLKGWTLADLGGITHQTVSGFMMTGSAGGTLMYTLEDNLLALRVIDGTGKVEWIEKDKDEDLFNAAALSLGLLGIISKVRFKLTPNFYIYGQMITKKTDAADSPIDLYGNGGSDKPSMEEFIRQTPYTRILWWPQKGVERIVIWEAVRNPSIPVFDPVPYYEFTTKPFSTQLEQLGASVLFTLLGNKGFLKTWRKLGKDFKQFKNNLRKDWLKNEGKFLGGFISGAITFILKVLFFFVVLFFSIFKSLLIKLYPTIVDILQPLTKDGKAQLFMDYMWRSLPMDNGADDILMGTEFTEIWIPVSETAHTMRVLKKLFDEKGTDASGYYSTELYAGKKSSFWLSPSYGGDMFRVDVFWYINNEGNPAAKGGFYSQFWDTLRKENIPFLLHWAKFIPEYNYKEWAEYYRSMHPKWNDFMELRKQRDPKNIFLNDYWSQHLFGEVK